MSTITVKQYLGDKALTVDEAKKLLGYTTEKDSGKKFGDNFLFKNSEGEKVRLLHNLTNRPFRRGLALRYANEILRKKWEFNGEVLIKDAKESVQDGQHRLLGLIFADEMRKKDEKWKLEYGWRSSPTIETVLIMGISAAAKVVDSIGTGQRRSLGDVMYRDRPFGKGEDTKTQTKMANILAQATRLVWLRAKGKGVSDAPHFPHSEALEFFNEHPRLAEAVEYVLTEEGEGDEGKKISSYVSLSYAAGMLYLMGMSKSDPDTGVLDDSNWEKACEFWTIFANGLKSSSREPVASLREYLQKRDASSGSGRDEIIQAIVNAWNFWIEGEEAGQKEIKPRRHKNPDTQKLELADDPRIGGLDVAREQPVEEEEEEGAEEVVEKPVKAPKKAKTAKTAKTAKAPKKAKKPAKDEYGVGEKWWIVSDKVAIYATITEVAEDTFTLADDEGQEYVVEKEGLYNNKTEAEEAFK